MLPRKVFQYVLWITSATILTGCASLNADGVWVGAYQIHESEPSLTRQVIEIKDNHLIIKSLYLPIETSESDTLEKKISIRRALNHGLSINKFSEDSLGLTFKFKDHSSSYIFKKIPNDSYKKEIDHDDFRNKVFVTTSQYFQDTLEFLDVSTYLSAQSYHGGSDFWMIRKFRDYNFLVVGQRENIPLIPITNSDGHSSFHAIFNKDIKVNFRQLKEKIDISSIYGYWNEVKTIYPDSTRPAPLYKLQLQISPESIQLDNEDEPRKWILSPSGRYILFDYEYRAWDMREKAWKIVKLTDTQLFIQRASGFGQNELVELLRAK